MEEVVEVRPILLAVLIAQHLDSLPVILRDLAPQRDASLDGARGGVVAPANERAGGGADVGHERTPSLCVHHAALVQPAARQLNQVVALLGAHEAAVEEGARAVQRERRHSTRVEARGAPTRRRTNLRRRLAGGGAALRGAQRGAACGRGGRVLSRGLRIL